MEMDKGQSNESSSLSASSSSSAAATITNSSGSGSSSRETFLLKHVNKNSHKIAKPIRKHIPPPPTNASSSSSSSSSTNIPILDPNPLHPGPAPPQSQQPPVYNINKNDFRDVVQKLTGSPAHERFPTPPPPPVATNQRPSSSRLQRIRPPPLAQIVNRPPQLTYLLPRPQNDAGQRDAAAQGQPFPPLPPLPSVHSAAESPISAYMRFLQSSTSSLWNRVAQVARLPDSLLPQNDFGLGAPPFSPLPPAESPISAYMRFLQSSARPSSAASPRQQRPPPSSAAFLPVLPLSPLPFGCVPSPRSPYGLISPTGQLGLPQLPLSSPTLPVPSPRWKGV